MNQELEKQKEFYHKYYDWFTELKIAVFERDEQKIADLCAQRLTCDNCPKRHVYVHSRRCKA